MQVNGVQYVFVAGGSDQGVQVLSIGDDGQLTLESHLTLPASLNFVQSIRVMTVGANVYLVANAVSNAALTVLQIENDDTGTDGTLTFVSSVVNGSGGALLSQPYGFDAVTVAGKSFVLAATLGGDALSVYELDAAGQLTLRDQILDGDDPDFNLNGPFAVASHQVGNKTFVLVGDQLGDNGISVFELDGTGILSNVSNVTVAGSTAITDFAGMQIGSQHYVFASEFNGDRILAYTMAANGELAFVEEFKRTSVAFNFSRLEVIHVDGVPFLLATGDTNKLVVLSFDETAGFRVVQKISAPVELNNAFDTTTLTLGTRTFVLLTATGSSRITVVEIGAGDDPLVGTGRDDQMVGMNGNDDLIGLGGADVLFGDAGEDVLSGRTGDDTLHGGTEADVLVGGVGSDQLRGGAGADVLVGNAGLDFADYTGSADRVVVDLAQRTASGGDAAGDVLVGVEGVIGSDHEDSLTGSAGANVILGGAGDDTVLAGGGADSVEGGDGFDVLAGGDGDDTLNGGQGNDQIGGGSGTDRLIGLDGSDTINGGSGNDVVNGGTGNDVIAGEADDDALTGGTGSDRFVFVAGFGADIITDFDVTGDVIDVSAIAGMNTLADVQAVAFTVAGTTFISIGADSIQIDNVTEAELTAANFVF